MIVKYTLRGESTEFKNLKEVSKMKKLYSIGEVSKIKEVTIKALRYYQKVGILIPAYIDENTGYRYYSIDQFVHIDIIKGCRTLGTSISELQEIFKEKNTDKLLDFLQDKKKEAEENINRMKDIINNIDELSFSIQDSKYIAENDDIVERFFEDRYIIVTPCKEVGDLKELIYYSNLEKMIRHKKVESSMDRGIIYKFNSSGTAKPVYVFDGIKFSNNVKIDEHIKILPKGRYITLSYTKENESKRIEKLIKYAKDNNLKVKWFIEMELFNDLFNVDSYSCQIQMFIE